MIALVLLSMVCFFIEFWSITYCKKLVQLHRPYPVRRLRYPQHCARIRTRLPRAARRCRAAGPSPPRPRSPVMTTPTRTVAPFSSFFNYWKKKSWKTSYFCKRFSLPQQTHTTYTIITVHHFLYSPFSVQYYHESLFKYFSANYLSSDARASWLWKVPAASPVGARNWGE